MAAKGTSPPLQQTAAAGISAQCFNGVKKKRQKEVFEVFFIEDLKPGTAQQPEGCVFHVLRCTATHLLLPQQRKAALLQVAGGRHVVVPAGRTGRTGKPRTWDSCWQAWGKTKAPALSDGEPYWFSCTSVVSVICSAFLQLRSQSGAALVLWKIDGGQAEAILAVGNCAGSPLLLLASWVLDVSRQARLRSVCLLPLK